MGSKLVKEYRLKRGLSQNELGKLIGTSGQLISNVERDAGRSGTSIPAEKMKAVSRVLGVPVKLLVEERVKQYKSELLKRLGES